MKNPWDPDKSMASKEVKADRLYTKDHEWAKLEDEVYTIGVTSFAVDQLGDITLVGFDIDTGNAVKAGDSFGTIESVKTLSDLFSPVSGTVVEINESLIDEPELINDDPWGKGWLIKVKASNNTEHTISPEEYQKLIGEE